MPVLAADATSGEVFVNSADVKWQDAPPSFPKGAKVAVLYGDPHNPGPFVMRLKAPAGYKIPPHWHSKTENLTVISGTLFVGRGDTVDVSQAHGVKAGGFHSVPAEAHHYVSRRPRRSCKPTAKDPSTSTTSTRRTTRNRNSPHTELYRMIGALNDPAICRGVILDLDGTIVDSAPDLLEAAQRMRAELPELFPAASGELTLEQIETFVGKGAEHLVRRVLAIDHSATEVERRLPQALGVYLRHYRAVNGLFSTVYPGVVEGVEALRGQKLRLVCVTNKPAALADALLEQIGLRDAFECVVGGDSLPRRKPDPLPMLHACAKLQVTPAEVIAIGDSINDAQAARAAGCRVWVVPYGYNHGEDVACLLDAGLADAIVPSLLDAAHRIFSGCSERNSKNSSLLDP